ncbi:protein SMG9 isoform X1 [Morus notabilis]|uniref:protein SMG9 isoform X1 n=1 Tax=Morus notabilis TaxID=981085 RepID=UPI000CED5A49|nr:protein SMG9 isoform X1 [Morus notabilis]
MAGSGSTGGSGQLSNPSSASLPPKILLAKPALVTGAPVPGKFSRGGGGGAGVDDDTASLRSRLPSIGSLNLLSESWDFHIDRFLPGCWKLKFLTENTDFAVIGVIGPPGVGKSTIMNELYGFDPTSPGMLPPYTVQLEEVRAMARHCSMGIEPRVSAERLILLDTQPVLSPSVLAEIMRPDGSSTIPVPGGESLSAELAHEIMSIQLGVLLTSICHILLVVSEGVHDQSMWRLMSTVDLLKHGIPDPSSLTPSPSQSSTTSGPEKDSKDKVHEAGEYMAAPIFVHMKLQDQDLTVHNCEQLKKALTHYFSTSSFMSERHGNVAKEQSFSSVAPSAQSGDPDSVAPNLFVIPARNKDESPINQYESHTSVLWKLRDQVLSMNHLSFSRTLSERDWLKNSAKIWELVKNSAIIAEYSKTLQNSGLYRR